MREFISENKILVIIISALLVLCSAFVLARKTLFYSLPEGEKPVFFDVYGNEIVVSGSGVASPRVTLLISIILTVIITPLLLGGWFLVKKVFGRSGQRPQESETDRRRKSDLKKIQETLELYYRLRQHYPEAGDDFRKIIKTLKPPLEGSLSDYHYENPESDLQHYRLWCILEDKTDPEAKDGIYELTPD